MKLIFIYFALNMNICIENERPATIIIPNCYQWVETQFETHPCVFSMFTYTVYLVYTSIVIIPELVLHRGDDQRPAFLQLNMGTEIGAELATEYARREREYVRGGRQVVEGHEAVLVIQEDAYHLGLGYEGQLFGRGRHCHVALTIVMRYHPVVVVGLEHKLAFPLRGHRRYA